ncbi:hypothetical protein JCM21900_000774 [Sporobolomyces salmonicolor]
MNSTVCEDCTPSTPTPATSHALPPLPPSDPTSTSSSLQPEYDPLFDRATFVPPNLSDGEDSELPRVVIEFCDRCRWLHRATWTLTELFLTFPPPVRSPDADPAAPPPSGLRAISLVPRNSPETGGRFRVWLLREKGARGIETTECGEVPASWKGWELCWDRKIEGGFPEMKQLKQRIRDLISPKQHLGHSDKPAKGSKEPGQPPIDAQHVVTEQP